MSSSWQFSFERNNFKGINPPMALDVQWLRTADSTSHCLIGALRNGYLWAGDANSACMGAIETPLSALSCVAAWCSDSGSFAAAAGQGSSVLLYRIGYTEVACPPQGDASSSGSLVAKKKKKKVHCHMRSPLPHVLCTPACYSSATSLLAHRICRLACGTSVLTSSSSGVSAYSAKLRIIF
jgi:hypothetical protein